mgnify:CR=1 FL=1
MNSEESLEAKKLYIEQIKINSENYEEIILSDNSESEQNESIIKKARNSDLKSFKEDLSPNSNKFTGISSLSGLIIFSIVF